jgi:dihydrofolate reductase
VRRLSVFNFVSLDGYFSSVEGGNRWLRNPNPDSEWDALLANNATSEGQLLLGRITYDALSRHWTSPRATLVDATVARAMNAVPKVVFSRTLEKASWNNTRVVKSDILAEVRKLKEEPGFDMVILGSGSIITQLTHEGLIDEYQLVVVPIVLGDGRSMFHGLQKNLPLKLTNQRSFANGNIILSYEPSRNGSSGPSSY